MRALRRWGLVVGAAMLVGAFGMAGPAHAVPSGFGWSASWQYYAANAFETHVKLPGGEVAAYALDPAGIRSMNGSVIDTNSRDRYCARVRVIATDFGSPIASETACDGGYAAFDTGEFTGAVFVHLDLMSGNTIVKSTFTFVPSSANDATLRTVDTGTSWFYANASDYHIEVHRPGVDVYGDGAVQGGGKRSVLGAVADSGVAGSCVDARAVDASISAVGWACEPGSVGNFNSFNFMGYINITGCSYAPAAAVRCLMVHFPEPY
jgi:hypothetical protein